MLTPHAVHYGHAEALLEHQQRTLAAVWRQHRERFALGQPNVGTLPEAVWINLPAWTAKGDIA